MEFYFKYWAFYMPIVFYYYYYFVLLKLLPSWTFESYFQKSKFIDPHNTNKLVVCVYIYIYIYIKDSYHI